MRRKENSLLSLQVKGGKVSERLQPLRSIIFFLWCVNVSYLMIKFCVFISRSPSTIVQ